MTDQTPPASPPPQSAQSATAAADNLTARRIAAAGVISAPWIFFVLQLLLLPGYVMPMFRHPTAGPILICMLLFGFAVSAVVWFCLQRTQKPVVWALLIILVVAPQTLASMAVSALGPAIVVIVQALGPVVGSSEEH